MRKRAFEILHKFDVKIFDFNELNGAIIPYKDIKAIQIEIRDINNPIIILETITEKEIIKYLGECEYKFRKGVGYKGEIYRLKFKELKNNSAFFFRFKKERRQLRPDESNILELNIKSLKYIYPLVLSPDIKDNGLRWSENYIIFPYKEGQKQPVDEDTLKAEAPDLYNYLYCNRDIIVEQSRYNKRIQNVKEFYGLIRVGHYTYANFYVAMRDNSNFISCVVEKIRTHWNEIKIPIFDNHISYISLDTKKEAGYISKRLNDSKLRKIAKLLFDPRSIPCRIPFEIKKYKG